jgi:hypothetical protein
MITWHIRTAWNNRRKVEADYVLDDVSVTPGPKKALMLHFNWVENYLHHSE